MAFLPTPPPPTANPQGGLRGASFKKNLSTVPEKR